MPFVTCRGTESVVGLINFIFGGESEVVRGVRVVKARWFELAMVAFARFALKTEEAVLDELAEPTPLRRSPAKGSVSSWFRGELLSLGELSTLVEDFVATATKGEVNETRAGLCLPGASSTRSAEWLGLSLSWSRSLEDFRC